MTTEHKPHKRLWFSPHGTEWEAESYEEALEMERDSLVEQLETMRGCLTEFCAFDWHAAQWIAGLQHDGHDLRAIRAEDIEKLKQARIKGRAALLASNPATSSEGSSSTSSRTSAAGRTAEALPSEESSPASSPLALPVCPECAEGRHVYCLDDGSSTWTDKCRCTCRESRGDA